MSLTDATIRALKPADRPYKVADEKGLYLLVTPAGGKLWKQKYRIGGVKEGKLSLGSYPDVSLKDARELRDAARKLIAQGVDPAEQKRHNKHIAKISAANSFSAVAKAYIDKRAREGSADATTCRRNWLLQLVERPLGHRPVVEIAPYEVLEALRRYETTNRVHATHRALQFVGQVFRFAVANQLVPSAIKFSFIFNLLHQLMYGVNSAGMPVVCGLSKQRSLGRMEEAPTQQNSLLP